MSNTVSVTPYTTTATVTPYETVATITTYETTVEVSAIPIETVYYWLTSLQTLRVVREATR
jgi:hypothetical protein